MLLKTESLSPLLNQLLLERTNSIYEPEIIMKNTKLNVVDQLKILGLSFDKKLTWSSHINYLKLECNKRLKFLKVIASYKWGADTHVLRRT